MRAYQLAISFILVVGCLVIPPYAAEEQEHEFVNLVKDLLQGDELKTFQSKTLVHSFMKYLLY